MAWVHRESYGPTAVHGFVDADPSAGAGLAAPVGSIARLNTGIGSWEKAGAADTAWTRIETEILISDPGDAGAVPITSGGRCEMTSGAVNETRTVAAPSYAGMELILSMEVDGGGDIEVTFAAAFDSVGNTKATFNDVKDVAYFEAVDVGGTPTFLLRNAVGVALT